MQIDRHLVHFLLKRGMKPREIGSCLRAMAEQDRYDSVVYGTQAVQNLMERLPARSLDFHLDPEFEIVLAKGIVWKSLKITIEDELPQTVVQAMPGELLARFIEHPAMDPGIEIDCAMHKDGKTLVYLHTGEVEWSTVAPASMLDMEVARIRWRFQNWCIARDAKALRGVTATSIAAAAILILVATIIIMRNAAIASTPGTWFAATAIPALLVAVRATMQDPVLKGRVKKERQNRLLRKVAEVDDTYGE